MENQSKDQEFEKSVKAAHLEFDVEPMDQLYQNKLGGYFSRLRVKKILENLPHDSTVLDLGCEAGHVSLKMHKHGCNVISLDLCLPTLKKFKHKLEKENNSSIHPFQAIAQKIPLKDNSVDAVVATEVFEHMPDLPSVISEMHRITKPGGKVIVTFPNEPLRKKGHGVARLLGIHTEIEDEVTLYDYTFEEIKEKIAKHFTIQKAFSFPSYLPLTRFILAEK